MRLTPCHRCKGAGFFPEFRHVSNGVCFRCNGSRYEELFNNHGSFTIERSLSPSADSYDLIKSSYKEDKKEWYFKMGRNYHLGLNGYERNIRKAYDHYYKAAIQGYGKAQKLLGDIYKFGNEEIDVNYGKARRWYMYAAMQGRYEAYLSLVDLFKKGLGVEKSNHIAQEWKSTYENKEESLDIEWIAPEMNLSAFVTLHGPCKPKQRIDRFSGLTVHSIDAYDGTSADFSKELEAELLSNKTEGKKFQLDINKLFIMEFRIKSTKKSGFLAYYSDKSSMLLSK